MALFDYKRSASRAAGKPVIPTFTVVAGAAINTNIAVTGIKREDGLLAILDFQDTAGATQCILANRVAETSVTSDGNIQLTTTNTTGHGLLVVYLKRRP